MALAADHQHTISSATDASAAASANNEHALTAETGAVRPPREQHRADRRHEIRRHVDSV
jgi:hypothetical protein